jgi:hypothetical protein
VNVSTWTDLLSVILDSTRSGKTVWEQSNNSFVTAFKTGSLLVRSTDRSPMLGALGSSTVELLDADGQMLARLLSGPTAALSASILAAQSMFSNIEQETTEATPELAELLDELLAYLGERQIRANSVARAIIDELSE